MRGSPRSPTLLPASPASRPLAFDSVDEKPVDLICLVLLPERQSSEQLNVLAASRGACATAPRSRHAQGADPKTLYAAATGGLR